MVLNLQLAKRVRDHLVAHPESHDQDLWMNRCGTVGCTAGWVVVLSGKYRYRVCNCSEDCNERNLEDLDGFETSYDVAAQRELGLTNEESSHLFYSCNESDAVWYLDWLLDGHRGVPGDVNN